MTLSSGNVSKYGFLADEDDLSDKGLLEIAATIKWFEYSQLGSELKKQTDIGKDQRKFFNDQMNDINNNNRKNDFKKEGYEMNDADHNHIDDKNKDLINDIYKSRLRNQDFNLTKFNN